MTRLFRAAPCRVLATLVATALAVLGLPALTAHADTRPAGDTPATVTADALPTWQINGVVWQQAMVGNTVYAVGSFTKARPAGVAPGGPGEVDANNILAYDITTGERIASFNHQLNGQALAVTTSPDGRKLYIGGDFTTVDGISRTHIAAFDTATGALDTTFLASVSTQTRALVATSATVYIGGNYGKVNGQPRSNLAAVDGRTGALLAWAPSVDDAGYVWSMVMAPSGRNLIVGGSFTTLSGTAANGMGSIDAATGAILPWAANATIREGGINSATVSLRTDGRVIYGSGYAFGTGNFEGTFAADPDTGELLLVNDCHGDTYDTLPLGQVLYTVSHSHDCTPIGGYPDTSPRVRWQQAVAFTTYQTGVNTGPDSYGWNYAGYPAGSALHWFPDFAFGNYTSESQAGWSLTGNSDYIAVGGEFPKVNGMAQQGLVRFARTAIAPNKSGPTYSTMPSRPIPPTTALSLTPGRVRVTFGTAWDFDNEELTYDVLRDNTTYVFSTKQKSSFWSLPTLGFTDTGVATGTSHFYAVRIRDPLGNTQWSPKSATVTVADETVLGGYAKGVLADGATSYWRLGEASGATAYDYASLADLGLTGTYARGAAGAVLGDANTATSFSGSTTFGVTQQAVPAPTTFSLSAWVNTTTTAGGKIVGFGDRATGTSKSYDRHLYMDTKGQVYFGVAGDTGVKYAIGTATALNDGQWHQVTGTFDASGMTLYVDGLRAARGSGPASPMAYSGYWRVGGDASWSGASYFKGSVDDVAVYQVALAATQVRRQFTDSGRPLAPQPAPADAYGAAVTNSGPDLYWRLGEASGPTAADSSGVGTGGTYSGGVTFGTAAGITGTTDTAVNLNGSNGVVYAKGKSNNPTSYSEELWFRTTTNRGGRLVGFGSAQTGLSSSYDRQVCMLNTGGVRFSAGSGANAGSLDATRAYNDGLWHHVVATQGAGGMRLYVDGLLASSNAQTTPQNYVGYWRAGGDRGCTGATNSYFTGSIDEVSVYSTALAGSDVVAHFKAGGGELPNEPPSAAFASSARYLAVTFDGTSSTDPEGKPLAYAWTFGDGGTSTSPSPSHTYAAAGSYTVTLKVTDVKGAASTSAATVTVVVNGPPTTDFISSATYLSVAFDGSASADPEGGALAYSWGFGDGGTSTSGSPNHAYAASGTYQVTLTVTDAEGATASATHPVTVAEMPNDPPTAAFGAMTRFLVASFDPTGSSDPEGGALDYQWDFGDGSAISATAAPSHAYATSGTYQATLTVTDPKGASASVSHSVTVVANGDPTAVFDASPSHLAVAFDGSDSSDPEGAILTYAWDFGDGTPGATTPTPGHTYAAAGTYTVTLVVRDPEGSGGTVSHDVTVAEAPNQAPTAAFTSAATQLEVAFDGSSSSDPEGGTLTYAWDFGDQTPASTEQKPSHTYGATGTYAVTLTVTDPKGATATRSRSLSVTSVVTLASDDFTRTLAAGWGSADTGGAWTMSTTARTSVAGEGTMTATAAGQTTSALLQSVSTTDADVQTQLRLSAVPVGGTSGIYASVIGRRIVGAGDYRAKYRVLPGGAVRVGLTRLAADGTETAIAAEVVVSGLTYAAGEVLSLRVQVTGTSPTTVRAKAWKAGTPEPVAWSVTTTDLTAALQAPGGVGLVGYLSGSVTNAPLTEYFDAYRVFRASTL